MMSEKTEKFTITTEYIRLDQFLKLTGAYTTGGEAKTAIQNGSVIVNTEICPMRGKKLRPGDTVQVSGRTLLVTLDEG
jgi:ribosome-associated protein